MSNAMPAYMKIRAHLMNIICSSGDFASPIPPENELCKLFGVTRPTVRNAIRGLVDDGYLTARKGLGTFINPNMAGRKLKRCPVIGILNGDGQLIINCVEPPILQCVVSHGLSFELLYLPVSKSPESLAQIVKSGVDAVLWTNASATAKVYLDRLLAEGVPLLCVNMESEKPFLDCDFVYSNRAERGVKLAESLYAKGHKDLLFVHNWAGGVLQNALAPGSTHDAYCGRMDELCGGEAHETAVMSLLEFEEKAYQRDASLKRFSVVYSLASLGPYLAEGLRMARLSVPDDVSCVLYGTPMKRLFRDLDVMHFDRCSALCDAIGEWLDLRLFTRDLQTPFQRKVSVDLVNGETVASRT